MVPDSSPDGTQKNVFDRFTSFLISCVHFSLERVGLAPAMKIILISREISEMLNSVTGNRKFHR